MLVATKSYYINICTYVEFKQTFAPLPPYSVVNPGTVTASRPPLAPVGVTGVNSPMPPIKGI